MIDKDDIITQATKRVTVGYTTINENIILNYTDEYIAIEDEKNVIKNEHKSIHNELYKEIFNEPVPKTAYGPVVIIHNIQEK